MLLLALLAAAPQTSGPHHYVISEPIPPLGSQSGPVHRIRAGSFDVDDETPDLLTLQGTESEFLLNPSVPTPNWLTELTATSTNDLAVLAGTGPQGRDVALSIGAAGLVQHDWNPVGSDAFGDTVLAGGPWIGGTYLEAIADGPGHLIVGLDAAGTSLLRATLVSGVFTELPAIPIPTGLVEVAGIDWGGDGTLEVVVQIDGLGFYVLDAAGAVVGTFPTAGIEERMAVCRSTTAGDLDLLVVVSYNLNLKEFVLLGGNAGVYTNVLVLGEVGANDLTAFDHNGDGREDVVLLESDASTNPQGGSSLAQIYHRDGAFSLTGVQRSIETIDANEEGPQEHSVSTAVADFDNDGDEDLAFVSGDGTRVRIWHSDAVHQDAQILRPMLNIVDTAVVVGESATLSLRIPEPDGYSDTGAADSILVEVWRMNDTFANPVFEHVMHARGVHAHAFATSDSTPVDIEVVVNADPGNELSQHAFRVDLTLVRTSGGVVQERFVTTPIWYTNNDQLLGAIAGETANWPFLLGNDPENTTGPINGSGTPSGSPPPSPPPGGGGGGSSSSGGSSGSGGGGGSNNGG